MFSNSSMMTPTLAFFPGVNNRSDNVVSMSSHLLRSTTSLPDFRIATWARLVFPHPVGPESKQRVTPLFCIQVDMACLHRAFPNMSPMFRGTHDSIEGGGLDFSGMLGGVEICRGMLGFSEFGMSFRLRANGLGSGGCRRLLPIMYFLYDLRNMDGLRAGHNLRPTNLKTQLRPGHREVAQKQQLQPKQMHRTRPKQTLPLPKPARQAFPGKHGQ